MTLSISNQKYACNLSAAGICKAIQMPADKAPVSLSPDKKKEAFIRSYNLWMRRRRVRQRSPTHNRRREGLWLREKDNAGWKQSDNPILVWSPDSKKIATFQQDQRKTGEMYLVPVTNGHPTLKAWKYPLVGDTDVTMIERVIIDVKSQKVVRLKMPPDQHRSTLCDDIACRGTTWEDVQWSPDATQLAFVSTSRDHRQEWLRVSDADTGVISRG